MGLDNGYGLGIGSLKPGVCTSSTRPTSPYEGQAIYETDTDKMLVYNGSAWYANWNTAWGQVGYVSKTSDTNLTTTTADITGLSITWTAVSGRIYKIVNNGTTKLDPIIRIFVNLRFSSEFSNSISQIKKTAMFNPVASNVSTIANLQPWEPFNPMKM